MSDILYTTIDATYPVAGVDNDTQGFRDNFSAISRGLEVAKTEITDLEQRTVKLLDSVGNPITNDFRESIINNASIENSTFRLKANAIQEELVNVNIDISNGAYQVYTFGTQIGSDNTLTFSLQNWPIRANAASKGVSKVTVHLYGNNNQNTAKFVADNSGEIYKDTNTWPTPAANAADADDSVSITVQNGSTPVIVEFWSYDSGLTVYANYLGTFSRSGS
jgi:hypothetical protein|tara:strand:- start:228 stop:890 length:663 start_codon:yes stop_codon:yes gene_type:complete